MKVRFLLDEHLPLALVSAMLRHDMVIDILRVGQADAPPLGTPDPDILRFCEREQRILVTGNRKSMPGHITSHHVAGWPPLERAQAPEKDALNRRDRI